MIRDANESDLSCLAAAMVRLQDAHIAAFPDVYRPFSQGDAVSHLSDLLSQSDAIVRVAEHESTIVGHAILLIETRQESMFTYSQRYGHLSQIEVEPDFRRQGYGRLLLADCDRLAAANELNRIILDVGAFNDAAQEFYETLGYRRIGSKMSRSI